MPKDEGRVLISEPGNVNLPEAATILHIFVDTEDGSKLKGKFSDGNVYTFTAGGSDVVIVAPVQQ